MPKTDKLLGQNQQKLKVFEHFCKFEVLKEILEISSKIQLNYEWSVINI